MLTLEGDLARGLRCVIVVSDIRNYCLMEIIVRIPLHYHFGRAFTQEVEVQRLEITEKLINRCSALV